MTQTQHLLLVRITRATARIAVNRVPVVVVDEPATRVCIKELSGVSNSAENTVSLDCVPSADGEFRVTVFRKGAGGEINEICSHGGTAAEATDLSFSGEPDSQLEGALDAPPVAAEDREAIGRVLAALVGALQRADVDSAMRLLDEKIQRRAQDVGISVADAHRAQRATVDEMVERRAALALAPSTQLQFHTVRDGQEVLVCRPDGRAPILAAAPGEEIGLRPSFSRLGGTWTIIR